MVSVSFLSDRNGIYYPPWIWNVFLWKSL